MNDFKTTTPRELMKRFCVAFGVALVALPSLIAAQTPGAYPARAIRVVVPFVPGGITDVGRTLGRPPARTDGHLVLFIFPVFEH